MENAAGYNEYFDSLQKQVKLKLKDYIKQQGRDVGNNGVYRCLLTQHHTNQDKNPSAHYSIKNGVPIWYCHACDHGGSIYDLAHYHEGLPIDGKHFITATIDLANWLNIPIEMDKLPKISEGEINIAYSMNELYREIENYLYQHGNGIENLMSGKFGRKYQKDYAEKACNLVAIGCVTSEKLTDHMRSKYGSKIEDLPFYDKEKKLIAPYVFNNNRLVISIRDRNGKPVAFTGRLKDNLYNSENNQSKSSPKYIFTKGFEGLKKSTLFLLDKARDYIKEQHKVYIAEGPFDVIAMHIAGFPNTVGLMGASLNINALDMLMGYKIYTIILLPDADKAGVTSVKRSLEKLSNYDPIVKVCDIEGGKDPDELLRAGNSEFLNNTYDAIEYVLRNDHMFYDEAIPAEFRFKEMLMFIINNTNHKVKYRDYAKIMSKVLGFHTEDIYTNLVNCSDENSLLTSEMHKVWKYIDNTRHAPLMDTVIALEKATDKFKELSSVEDKNKGQSTWNLFMSLISGNVQFPLILDTGFSNLDDQSDIECGSVTFVSGFPSNGKSSLLQYLAIKFLKIYADCTVLYISTDDQKLKPLSSFLGILTGLPKKDVKMMIKEDTFMTHPKVNSKIDEIQNLFSDRLILKGIDECYNISTIRKSLEKEKRNGNGPLITIVDAINDLSEFKKDDQRMGVEKVTGDLKTMAAIYDSAIIPVSHLVKIPDYRRPRLGDLKGSSYIEFAAKTILFVYMDLHYNKESELKWRESGITMGESFPVVEVQIAKDKDNKAAETAFLHFNPLNGQFIQPTSSQISYYDISIKNGGNYAKEPNQFDDFGIGEALQ